MEPTEVDSIMENQRQLLDNLKILQKEWQECLLHAKQAGRIQTDDESKVSNRIRECIKKMLNLNDATHKPLLRGIMAPMIKAGITVQAGLPVAGDSNTPSTSSEAKVSKPDPQEEDVAKASPPKPTCQPSTSGVKEGEISLRPLTGKSKIDTNIIEISPVWQMYQSRWEKINTRKGLNPSYCRVDVAGKYPRIWMTTGANPQEVKEWYEFGALASVYTTSPTFNEIKGLLRWIQETVYDAWANNKSLNRGDVLELYFLSAAPEPAGKGNHEAFHFIKLRRPDTEALNRIKAPNHEVSIVTTFTEEQISTRRAWGLWVCLTEMDKVKYQFKFSHNAGLGSFLLNSMTGKTTSFAEKAFEEKMQTLWRNKVAESKETRHKFCNMAHLGYWIDHICTECPTQKEPEFGKGFFPKPNKKKFRSDEHEEHQTPRGRAPRAPKK
ncbi:uncharacterized protein LOC131016273 [Salvia miltiorrhiza]|uniref:uncharacterized protein LOC131016273 n=1 Tax=Salvia miltiorrhiza TaxID=226208 RepID=UPI0025ABC784|nr:uncharacterized protein LOC131016273 [Salvia miltiorrhiza]